MECLLSSMFLLHKPSFIPTPPMAHSIYIKVEFVNQTNTDLYKPISLRVTVQFVSNLNVKGWLCITQNKPPRQNICSHKTTVAN